MPFLVDRAKRTMAHQGPGTLDVVVGNAEQSTASTSGGESAVVGHKRADHHLSDVHGEEVARDAKRVRRCPRKLPGSQPADPDKHFFIDVTADVAYITSATSMVRSTYLIRAPPGSGKTTFARQLCKLNSFLYLPLNEFTGTPVGVDVEQVLARLRQAVRETTETTVDVDSLRAHECIEKLCGAGHAVVVDEAQLLFELDQSNVLYQCLIKPTDENALVILFTTNSEYVQHGKLLISPPEIHKKFYWHGRMPFDEEALTKMKSQLEECNVFLEIDAIDALVNMSALHRGIFVSALRWVASHQEEGIHEAWNGQKLASEVQRNFKSFQMNLLSSRAVKVNGGATIPPPALQALAEGVAATAAFSTEMLRDAMVKGFIRPAQDTGSQEFLEYGMSLETPRYVLANHLQAVLYRDALTDAGIKCQLDAPQRSADILLRCLPRFFFHKLVSLARTDSSSKDMEQIFYSKARSVPLPHENAWNDLLLNTFNEDGSAFKKDATTQNSTSKPDFVWERDEGGPKTLFVIEAVMWAADVAEHIGRFVYKDTVQKTRLYRKSDKPDWANARGLWIIGETVGDTKDKMQVAADSKVFGSSCDVEVMGIVPHRGYRSMTFLYWQSNGTFFEAEIPCDGVPRKLSGADGTLQVDVARRVVDWGRVVELRHYVMMQRSREELAEWIRQQVSHKSQQQVDLVVKSFVDFTGKMFAEASKDELAQVIGDRKTSQLQRAKDWGARDLYDELCEVDPVAVAARLSAARDARDM